MAQHLSDSAAVLAFQSDIARALARRICDTPLHAQARMQQPAHGDAPVPAGEATRKEQSR